MFLAAQLCDIIWNPSSPMLKLTGVTNKYVFSSLLFYKSIRKKYITQLFQTNRALVNLRQPINETVAQ